MFKILIKGNIYYDDEDILIFEEKDSDEEFYEDIFISVGYVVFDVMGKLLGIRLFVE